MVTTYDSWQEKCMDVRRAIVGKHVQILETPFQDQSEPYLCSSAHNLTHRIQKPGSDLTID
jgi:hypothetical protein